jgi:hypothetical protein
MSQFPHDQFAKDLLESLLSPFGRVETDRKISSEVREIDVCFFPSSAISAPIASLGLLSTLAATGAAFEPFRNPVTESQIRSCMAKLYDLHAELERQQKRGTIRSSTPISLPYLWIFTPTLAASTLESFGAITETDANRWGNGVYLMPSGHRTGIVVIHQLPETPETLWLRVLGKHQVQKRAIDEIHQLDANHPYKQHALELLSDLKVVLEAKSNRDSQETELLMSLKTSPLYVEHIEKVKLQSRSEGLAEGRTAGERELILKLLTRKLGSLSPELQARIGGLSIDRLEALGEALLDFQSVGDLEKWLR